MRSMRRSPFYAFPAFPPHPDRPIPPSSASAPRSVINIPVRDSAPSPPPAPSHHPLPLLDPSCAATRIQSCFRGFRIRRHCPLRHLRSIVTARNKLNQLQSDLQSPGFADRVKSNEKERLCFTESVMALILRLDAVEGSIPEVRIQRKEVTKMAIKLQDAVDTIMMQQENATPVFAHTLETQQFEVLTGAMSTDSVQEGSSAPMVEEEPTTTDVMVEKEFSTPLVDEETTTNETVNCATACFIRENVAEGAMNANQSTITSPRAGHAGGPDSSPLQHVDVGVQEVQNAGAELVIQDEPPVEMVNVLVQELQNADEVAAELVIQDEPAETEGDTGLAVLSLDGKDVDPKKGACAVPSSNVSDSPHISAMEIHRDICVDDSVQVHDCVSKQSSSASDACINNQGEEGEKAEGQIGHPCSCPHRSCDVCPQSDSLKKAVSVIVPGKTLQCMHTNGGSVEEGEVPQPGKFKEWEGVSSDSLLLQQLSEDCRQLKSLVGKLLIQNKAQSKVICALGYRLEMLEQQQKMNCQHAHLREKRKAKKGSKRSAKHCKADC